MPSFVHLANADAYLPGLWDLRSDPQARRVWAERFRENMGHIVGVVAANGDAAGLKRAREIEAQWYRLLARLDEPEITDAYPTVHHLTIARDTLLRQGGLPDVYQEIKRVENVRALALYEGMLRARPAADGGRASLPSRLEEALWGVLAGNVFDLAAPSVTEAYRAGRLHFPELMARVRSRPVALDHRPAFLACVSRVISKREPKIVMLVDNAGMDFVLGCVPLARELGSAGFRITFAANELPTINDITAREAGTLLPQIGEFDPVVRDLANRGALLVVSTGNGSPGIDLRSVSEALNEAAADADLLVIEGQGRAVETTWNAILTLPVLRVATLKSPIVSLKLGLHPYDTVFDFREAGAQAPDLDV